MMKLYAIRHLPTKWNAEGLLQGSIDIPALPINQKNDHLIEKLSKQLEQLDFDLTACSSLTRARQTAEILNIQCRHEPLLDEMSFGKYEGMPKQSLITDSGEWWLKDPLKTPISQSYRNLERRVREFLHRYKSFDRILIFTHGSWIRAANAILMSNSIARMNTLECPNLSLSRLDFCSSSILTQDFQSHT